MRQVIYLIVLFTFSLCGNAAELQLDSRVERLDFKAPGRALLMSDGRFACVRKSEFLVSGDGASWDVVSSIPEGHGPAIDSGMLVEGRPGVLVLVYRDDAGYHLERTENNMPLHGARLQVWCVRSTDGGKTWGDHERLIEGYCGAMIDGMCTKDGTILLPLQDLRYEPPRHVTTVFRSVDDGATWAQCDDLDVGGYGIEDGSFEATVAQRGDGSILMYMRTARDRLWQSVSRDDGETWSLAVPTDIAASNSPAYLLALESGRLAMVWNPVHPDGQPDWPRRTKTRYAERPDSVYREELLFALSDDGGDTWTDAIVIAQEDGAKLRYGYMIERAAGEIWLALRGEWFLLREGAFAQ